MADNQDEVDVEDVGGVDWDYVFVFNNIKRPTEKDFDLPEDDSKVKKWKELQKSRRDLLAHLKSPSVGLRVAKKKSTDAQSLFVLITAPQERLEAQAEHLELKMRLKEEYGGGYGSFERERKHMFVAEDESEGFFRKLQKIQLMESILQGDPDFGGAGLNLDSLVRDGVINKLFPMHTEAKRKELIEIWGNLKRMFSRQPLLQIRNYFGEEITLYFAWLGFYTQWLWYASIAGIIASIFWLMDRFSERPWAAWGQTIYAIFLSIWATFFLEYWKRFNNTLNYEWGMLDYKEREFERPTFEGEPMLGVYHGGTWVPLDPDESKYDFSLPPKKKYYSTKLRRSKVVCSLPLVGTMITIVVVATFAVLALRLYVQKVNSILGSIVGGALNAITIIILNVVWKIAATKLNEWENYRTETEYENNLIVKIFAFYFVNSYTSLYYIAFFKRNKGLFNVGSLEDDCKSGRKETTISNGCIDELSIQLITILAVNMFIGQSREVALPWVMSKLQLLRLARSTGEETKKLPLWERDSKKGNFDGTFDEYSEMVIQYGYITLFAASFPLAPFLAVLNNMVEIRTDAFKLLTSYPRPEYRGTQSIGTWYHILEFLGIVAVMTNCALIGLSFLIIFTETKDRFNTLGIIILMEHVILALKYMISVLVPDLPGWIVKKLAAEDYIQLATIKAIKMKSHVKPTFEVVPEEETGDRATFIDDRASFLDDRGSIGPPAKDTVDVMLVANEETDQ